MNKLLSYFLSSLLLCSLGITAKEFTTEKELARQVFEEKVKVFRMKPAQGRSVKIKDLVEIVGEEKVKLQGFGVVSGLNKTGDSGAAATKMLLNVAKQQGIQLTQKDLQSKNIALVSISAEVSPHQRSFDVAVKSVSDAKSLQNGFLEAATLSPIGSSEVFGIASGAIALGARFFEAEGGGGGGASVTIGHPSAGFVMAGGELIKDIPSDRIENGTLTLFIKYPSDRTASNIANSINHYTQDIGLEAEPTSASIVKIYLPNEFHKSLGKTTRLIADIGDLPTEVSRPAIITIDQGSGVIAMTEGVKLEPGSIAVAGLTVTVTSNITPVTRQGAFDGQTDLVDLPELEVAESKANFLSIPAGTDLRKVQETFNALQLQPTSIISVFNAMKTAGMIHAEIIVMPH